MNGISQKGRIAWQIAIATALGAYGGFPTPPEWWNNLTKYKLFQFLTLWTLVYQGGGSAEYLWTTVVTAIVFFGMLLSQRGFPACLSTADTNEEYA